ncbi:MAG: FecR domain-containing protein [Opitutaceae bacterium]|nr:FecR domain-containing protein [Opitutaceae bacterium]
MAAPDPFSAPSSDDPIAVEAGAWLARRDRGLTAAEQDAFLQWLRADPLHRTALARLDRAWTALDSLAAWQPADGTRPNPDLLARSASRRRGLRPLAWAAALAGAGVATAIALLMWPAPSALPEPPVGVPSVRVIARPEQQALVDGSVAELNHGGNLEVAFGAAERRVRLRDGEVHLTVAKDAARPFVVEAGGVNVRAIGTAFNVRRDLDSVDVIVTEGRVQLETKRGAPVPLAAGERARVTPGERPVVSAAEPSAVARELAWRAVRLEFEALPLEAVIVEFNLRNARQLTIGDPAAGRVKVAGTFRADEPEAFARLLEVSFGIAVERAATGPWVLRSAAR